MCPFKPLLHLLDCIKNLFLTDLLTDLITIVTLRMSCHQGQKTLLSLIGFLALSFLPSPPDYTRSTGRSGRGRGDGGGIEREGDEMSRMYRAPCVSFPQSVFPFQLCIGQAVY